MIFREYEIWTSHDAVFGKIDIFSNQTFSNNLLENRCCRPISQQSFSNFPSLEADNDNLKQGKRLALSLYDCNAKYRLLSVRY